LRVGEKSSIERKDNENMMQAQGPVNVKWGEWIGEGWQMFVERWQVWVLQFLIFFAVFAIPLIPVYAMIIMADVRATQAGDPPPPPPPFFIPFVLIALPILMIAGAFLLGGVWKTAFKQLRGEPIAVRDLFSGGDVMLKIIGAYFVIGLMGMLGAILCILPAFFVMGVTYFTVPYMIERNTSVGEAVSASYEATKNNWFMYILFALFLGIFAGIGQYACLVGLLVTYPLTFTIVTVAYRDIFGVAGARRFGPQTVSTASSYVGQNWPTPPSVVPPPPAPMPPLPPPFAAPTEELGEEPPTIFPRCPKCGAAIASTAKFCNFCGHRLQSE
jgi:hypothetical protein